LAAEMCVPEGEHLAHLLALAVDQQMTVKDMLAMPFYHPVLEEGLRGALRELAKNVATVGGSDLSDCKAIGYDALD
jgi:dihydrolipoamide dehydrogenase